MGRENGFEQLSSAQIEQNTAVVEGSVAQKVESISNITQDETAKQETTPVSQDEINLGNSVVVQPDVVHNHADIPQSDQPESGAMWSGVLTAKMKGVRI